MPGDELLTDDYIASLLVNDAKDLTLKYSAQGLQALLPRKHNVNAPKPNTRFLKNIIQETDSHNATLRAKEVSESRLRLRGLQSSRQAAAAIGNGEDQCHRSKRRKITEEDREPRNVKGRPDQQLYRPKHHSENESPGLRRRAHGDEEEESRFNDRHRCRRHRHRKHERLTSNEEKPTHHYKKSDRHRRSENPRRRGRSTDRSRSPSLDRTHELKSYKHSHRRDPSSLYTRSRSHSRSLRRVSSHYNNGISQREEGHRSMQRSLKKITKFECSEEPEKLSSPASSMSSDPLDTLIGPAPPLRSPSPKVKRKGRGAARSLHTNIDTHFASTYDPALDVHPNSASEDDWDQALEALKDRQRWKQQGADRLRQAGFTENDIEKWERGGEKQVQDVTWASKGEDREWDRGKKAMNDDYGRLR